MEFERDATSSLCAGVHWEETTAGLLPLTVDTDNSFVVSCALYFIFRKVDSSCGGPEGRREAGDRMCCFIKELGIWPVSVKEQYMCVSSAFILLWTLECSLFLI